MPYEVPIKYAYLLFCSLFFIPWSFLFFYRKDLRVEMIRMSFIAAFLSVLGAYFFNQDWWRPHTIFGTLIGIEDFLLGFSNGGIAVVLYEEIFHKALYKSKYERHSKGIILILTLSFIAFVTLILFFKLTSFISYVLSLGVTGTFLVFKRRDLFIPALVNGLLTVLIVFPIYHLVIAMSPNFIEITYPFNTLSKVKFTGVPIEEFIFYFWLGFVALPLYEYWQGLGLKALPRTKVNKKRR